MSGAGLEPTGEDSASVVERGLADLHARLPAGFTPHRVLDFGCGRGDATRALSELFPSAQVVGYDVSAERAARAAERHAASRVRFVHGDPAALRAEGRFDLCYCSGVLHQIAPSDRLPALQELRALLSPDAVFALFEENPYSPAARWALRRSAGRDGRLLRPGHARRLLSESGFAVQETRHLAWRPRLGGALDRLEERLSRLPLGRRYWILSRRRQAEPGRAVQERWGHEEFFDELEATFWMTSRWVQYHLNRRATGHPHADWLIWFLRQVVMDPPEGRSDRRCLVLGCGEGWLERRIAEESSGIGAIDAEDIAEGAVERARRTAAEQGLDQISYRVGNLDVDELPAGAYDVVVAHSVLHHVDDLEHAFAQIQRTLRPDGVMAVMEYVGPKRLQYGDAALEVIDQLLRRLPERYRRHVLDGRVISQKPRPPLEFLMAVDPSESIRSDELPRFLHDHFDIVYEAPLHGAVIQHLLYEIVGNFDDDSALDGALIGVMAMLEELLTEAGELEPDFVFYVARPRGEGGRHQKPPRHEMEALGFLPRPWSEEEGAWTAWPAVERHLRRVPSGDPSCDWLTRILEELRERGLGESARVLLYGDSWLAGPLRERFETVSVLDPSEAAPEGVWDIVFSSGGILRAETPLAHQARTLHRMLRPGGALVANEWLPTTARTDALLRRMVSGLLWSFDLARFHPPPVAAGGRPLPDELERRFGEVAVLPCGGELLRPILTSFDKELRGFDPEGAAALVDLLCYAEETLIRRGLLEPDHVVLRAWKEGDA